MKNLKANLIPQLSIQEQFGDKGNLVSLLVRYENDELITVNEYSLAIKTFPHILKEQPLPLKLSLSSKVRFHKGNELLEHNIQSHPYTLLLESKTRPLLERCLKFIALQIEERYFNGSGLSLDRILYLSLHIYWVKNYKESSFQHLPFTTRSVIKDYSLEPLYISEEGEEEEEAINLLYFDEHYVFITNISAFFKTDSHLKYVCLRCMNA